MPGTLTKKPCKSPCIDCDYCNSPSYDMFEPKEIKTNLRAIHYKPRPIRYKVRTDASHQCIKNKHYATE